VNKKIRELGKNVKRCFSEEETAIEKQKAYGQTDCP
jgi:hypothetical protein